MPRPEPLTDLKALVFQQIDSYPSNGIVTREIADWREFWQYRWPGHVVMVNRGM